MSEESEDVYAKPDLTKKVRYGRGDTEGEREDRGDWEERIVDIYGTANYPDPNPDPGIQLNAIQNNTAQQQHAGGEASKQNGCRAVEVCVGLLCLLLLAGIIVLVILYCVLIKEKNILQSSFDQLQTRHDDNMTGLNDQWNTRFDTLQTRLNNMTEQKDQWNTRFDNLQTTLNNTTEQKDNLQIRLNNMTEQKDNLQTRHNNTTEQKDNLQIRLNNMTGLKDQWNTRFDRLQTRLAALTLNNMTELKTILCESHGFTFGDGVCYYISTERKTWEESRTYCTTNQSDLVIINSEEKQDFVKGVVGRNKSVWLGLTDSDVEGDWKWVDGTPLTEPKYWHGPEPNDNGKGEDCLELSNGGWNDRSCSRTKLNWICEKKIW